MTDAAADCATCRHLGELCGSRTGPYCGRLEPAMPARFMRRLEGLCGPAAKLWEPVKPRKDGHARFKD
jgi:hypothetical protein